MDPTLTINPYLANVENTVRSNTRKWQMGFNSACKGLNGLEDNPLLTILIVHITNLSSLLHINGSNQNFTNSFLVNFHSSLGHC